MRDATGVVYQSQASALAALAFVAAFVGSPVPAQGAAITSAALSGFGVQGGRKVQDAQEARHQTATLKGCLAGASASAGALFVVACGMAESFEVGVQGDLIIVSRQQGSTQSIQSLLIRRS